MLSNMPPKSVCVLRLSAIGDVCHTLAVIRTLQAAWPKTQFTWVIGKLEATLIGDIPGIEFVVFDKSAQKRTALREFREAFQGRHFDILLHMQAALRASWLARLIHADAKIGFDKARAKDFQWLFTSHKIAAKPQQHVIEGLFGFAEHCGVAGQRRHWDIPLSADDHAFAKRYTQHPTLIISPCSSQRARNFRNWAAEHYAAIVDYAYRQYGLHTILTGGPTALEQEYGENISQLANNPVTNLIGQTTLKQLLALLKHSQLLIAPDSGPVHMATTVNTPVIGLYASSNPARTGPSEQQEWTVNAYPQAAQKYLQQPHTALKWGQRIRHPNVMDCISVDSVIERLDALIHNLRSQA